jgi:hypothetical protein
MECVGLFGTCQVLCRTPSLVTPVYWAIFMRDTSESGGVRKAHPADTGLVVNGIIAMEDITADSV